MLFWKLYPDTGHCPRFYALPPGNGVDSASKRNEYQEYFLGIKAAGS
jgi:hypothetical protein